MKMSYTGNIGHIKNPLTVISQFAAIAEISGTIILPFIAPENQAIFIWFLMIFPIFLVGAFFLTLNFNHKTLYAPSDYENQDDFLKLFGIVTPRERDEKLSAEAQETDEVQPPSEQTPPPEPEQPLEPAPEEGSASNAEPVTTEPLEIDKTPDTSVVPNKKGQDDSDSKRLPMETKFDLDGFTKRSHLESMAKLEFIERRSIEKLKDATGIDFSPKIKFEFPKFSKPIIFDAIANTGDTIHIAEVKYFDQKFSTTRFSQTVTNARIANQHLNLVTNVKVVLHLIVITNNTVSFDEKTAIKNSLIHLTKNFDVLCNVYIASVDDLASPFTPTSWMLATRS